MLSKTKPSFGADEGALQVNEYCPAKCVGHFEPSSSSENVVRPDANTAVNVWSSKGFAPARSWTSAMIGLAPQLEAVKVALCGADALPSASRTTTVAV